MQKATNYMRGSAILEATGPYPERFLNICSARGIRFWRVERVDETTVRLTVPLSQAGRARQLGPKCLCEVAQIGREGAPGFLLRFRDRYGLLLGLLLSLLAVAVLSRFVLVIDITGNTTVSDGVILDELREIGLYAGVYGPGVDERAISNRALLDLEELSFLTVNLRGIRAEVVVRERDSAPTVEPTDAAQDLVAEKSGRVVQIWTVAGQTIVEEGDTVEAGDTLISGTVVIYGATDPEQVLATYPVLAKGKVWAEVEETFSATTPLTATGKTYTGRTASQYGLVVLGNTFKISSKAFQPFTYYDKIEESRTLRLADALTLPFSLVIRRCAEYEPTEVTLDRDSAEADLRGLLEERLSQAAGEDGLVLEETWQVEERDGALTVTVTALCREQIAGSADTEE